IRGPDAQPPYSRSGGWSLRLARTQSEHAVPGRGARLSQTVGLAPRTRVSRAAIRCGRALVSLGRLVAADVTSGNQLLAYKPRGGSLRSGRHSNYYSTSTGPTR